jgi:hypothetical protein
MIKEALQIGAKILEKKYAEIPVRWKHKNWNKRISRIRRFWSKVCTKRYR